MCFEPPDFVLSYTGRFEEGVREILNGKFEMTANFERIDEEGAVIDGVGVGV